MDEAEANVFTKAVVEINLAILNKFTCTWNVGWILWKTI
jgi:hypothetical protein